ncbi:hypothetical protein SRHO_G00165730 [Serrasalmus rhombeus]
MDAGGRGGEEDWMEDQWEKWLTHDISLDEFEDEDLSEITEITDERGLSLNCNSLDIKMKRACGGLCGGVCGGGVQWSARCGWDGSG